jgi:hypothetical protein
MDPGLPTKSASQYEKLPIMQLHAEIDEIPGFDMADK